MNLNLILMHSIRRRVYMYTGSNKIMYFIQFSLLGSFNRPSMQHILVRIVKKLYMKKKMYGDFSNMHSNYVWNRYTFFKKFS